MSTSAQRAGILVTGRMGHGETAAMALDRTWMVCREAASVSSVSSASSAIDVPRIAARADAWACWRHLGVTYGADLMREVRAADAASHSAKHGG